jgi:hypothetical protein
VLYHQAMPLASSTPDLRVYLSVLCAVMETWDSDPAHEFVVAFAPSLEAQVRSLSSTGIEVMLASRT